jgi:hypothetical protein
MPTEANSRQDEKKKLAALISELPDRGFKGEWLGAWPFRLSNAGLPRRFEIRDDREYREKKEDILNF